MSITSESRMMAKILETCVVSYVMARVKKPGLGLPANLEKSLICCQAWVIASKKTCNRATKISPSKKL